MTPGAARVGPESFRLQRATVAAQENVNALMAKPRPGMTRLEAKRLWCQDALIDLCQTNCPVS
jgi:hypothetical protein